MGAKTDGSPAPPRHVIVTLGTTCCRRAGRRQCPCIGVHAWAAMGSPGRGITAQDLQASGLERQPGSGLARFSPAGNGEEHFVPLNIEPSSAPLPAR